MIIIKLLGGLGNQMFQYATAFAVAKKNNTNLAIDNDWFISKNSTVRQMSYELNCFNINSSFIKPSEYRIKQRDAKRLPTFFRKNSFIEYQEKGFLFDSKVFNQGSNIVLSGYWQSEKYFESYRKDILSEFSFADKPSDNNVETAQLITNTNSVSIHVRRGDYATDSKTKAYHGLTSLKYYEEAIGYISKKVSEPYFFVFSDDIEWCKKNLSIGHPHIFISGNKKGCYDMQLMSLCNHHILANSSFSWWGAWLSTNPKKNVICPKKWFNDASIITRDLIPNTWEKM